MGLFDFLRPEPRMSPDRVIEYGAFLVALNRNSDLLDVDRSGPIEVRISAFLIFGADVATSHLHPSVDGRHLETDEGAALIVFVQQGIHAMLVLYDGYEAQRTPPYRQRFNRIVSLTIPRILRSDPVNLSVECRRLMGEGLKAMKAAQASDGELLRNIVGAWQDFLHDQTDRSVEHLQKSFSLTLQSVRLNLN